MSQYTLKPYLKTKIKQLTVLGDGFVGKSAILRRFKGLEFEHEYRMTIGADFIIKKMDYKNNSLILQIWDVGGQEKFAPLRSKHYKNAAGVVIVFDLMKRHTYDSIPTWLNEVIENNNYNLVPLVLIGNKNDLKDSDPVEVTLDEINQYTQILRDWGIQYNPNFKVTYFETSAKSGRNINKAFFQLLDFILYAQFFKFQ